ncbi:MAG: EF-P lysine aminoacylase GenX [Xanthomonadales bacterium]|nr:EF-P lysine aminoacylase GenX [Xanthomonadales bacterium]
MVVRELLIARATLFDSIRGFFRARGVLEVTTPVLSQAGNTDPNIESFTTHSHGPQAGGPPQRWLRTSPEFFHKRLLAAGSGDIFEIAPVFRNGECGARHNPEFALLEWYRTGFDHFALMDEVAALVCAVAAAFGRELGPLRRLSFQQAFIEFASVDPLVADEGALWRALAGCGIDREGLGRDDALDLIRSHIVEPALAREPGVFIHAFPASQAALARIDPDDPRVARRFELYLAGSEIANGYHELGDATEQRARFERDLAIRGRRGTPGPAIDEALLSALPTMPDCAGVALGLERLLGWALHEPRIERLIAFPFALA